MDKEIIIKVSAGGQNISEILKRQTPSRSGVWKNCRFIFTNRCIECDYWVVMHNEGLKIPEKAICDPKNIIYVSMEPVESVGHVSIRFLNQFLLLVLTDPEVQKPNIIRENVHSWWCGINAASTKKGHRFDRINIDYDMFKTLDCPRDKVDKISIIVSNKEFLQGHRKRNRFVEEILRSDIAGSVDVYGGKYRQLNDKYDAIKGYKYHLVVENSRINGYWSEKLADAFLSYAYPIYYGAPDILKYFPNQSMECVDIDNVGGGLKVLRDVLGSKTYDRKRQAVGAARDMILDEYNLFNRLSLICNMKSFDKKPVRLYPAYWFRGSRVKSLVKCFMHIVNLER